VEFFACLHAENRPRACSSRPGGGSQSNTAGGRTILPSDDSANGRGQRCHFLTQ
jgi:hypothetical protein